MRKVKARLLAVLLILVLMVLLCRFRVSQILDIRQLILTAAGTGILYLTIHGPAGTAVDVKAVGRCAMLAGYLEAFVLVLVNLQSASTDMVLEVIGLNLRPALYGFCLWLVFWESGQSEKEKTEEQIVPKSVEDYYSLFAEKGLTRREQEIAVLAVRGLSNGEIGYELHIAETTVKKHMSNIFGKLGISSREELRS